MTMGTENDLLLACINNQENEIAELKNKVFELETRDLANRKYLETQRDRHARQMKQITRTSLGALAAISAVFVVAVIFCFLL